MTDSLDRLPPQAVEVEQAVIGACLAWGATDQALAVLRSSEVLYHRPHVLILGACQALASAGKAVDQLTVAEELKRRAQLDAVGGVAYLAELASSSYTGANVGHHCRIVLRAAQLRGILEAAQEAQDRVYRAELEPEAIAGDLEERLGGLAQGLGGGPRRLDGVLSDALDDLTHRHTHPGLAGVSTGLADLDGLTSGWQAGDLVVIAARPSVGKTGLAVGMVSTAARAGVGALLFSLEMSEQQVGHRLLSRQAGVDLHRLRTARLGAQEWGQVTTAAEELSGRPIWIDDTSGLTLPDLRSRARRLCRQEQIGLVAVDYLQLVEGVNDRDNQERETARISRGLKGLAKELQLPVLALSQLSRAPEGRSDHRPVLSDLRYSGSIEQDSDAVIFIYRPGLYGDEQTGIAELIIAKQRNGPVGVVQVHWHAETASFADLARGSVLAQEPELQEQWGNR